MIVLALLFAVELAGGWVSHGPGEASHQPEIGVAAGPGGRIYAAGYEVESGGNGIYRSDDAGASWDLAGGQPVADLVIAFEAHPLVPDRLFLAAMRAGFAGMRTRLFRSDDGGTGWTLVQDLSFPAAFCSIALDPVDPHLVYVAYSGEPYVSRSLDGGLSFTNQITSPFGGGVMAVATDGSLVAASGLDVFVSRDRAESWTMVSRPPIQCSARTLAVDPNDSRRWFVGTRKRYDPCGELARTEDGGETWTLLGDLGGSVDDLVLDAAHPGVLYAAIGPAENLSGTGRVLASADFGETWTDLDVPAVGRKTSLALEENGALLHAATRAGVYERSFRRPRSSPPPR
jgi:photosystem II stability/assembly factor-like uncharacterized protein